MPTSLSNPKSLAQNELQQALDYCGQEQWQQAIDCCAKALQNLSTVPGNESSLPPTVATRSYLDQANTFREEGNLASALDAYLKVLATQPDWGKVYAQVGTIYIQQKNWQLAQKYSQQALKLNPKLPEAYRNLALVMQQQGNPSAAAQYWYRALQLDPAWAQVKDYLSLGKTLQQQGNLAQAEDCYRRALALDPDGGETYYHLGHLLHIQGKQDEAIDCYHQADKLGVNTALLHFHWAETLADKSKLTQAVAKYRQAIKLKPDFWQAHHQLGNLLLHQDKLYAAVKAFRHAIELEPRMAWSHHHLGTALVKQGKLALAIAAYDRAIEVDPNTAHFYASLGQAWLEKGNVPKAIASLEKAVEIEPNSATNYLKLAAIYNQQGNLDLEVDSYLKAIEIQPDSRPAHVKLRCNLLRYEIKNDSPLIDKIIASCRQVITQHPKSVSPYNTLGYALTKKGQLEEAVSQYQQASKHLGQVILPHVSPQAWENAQRKPPKFMVIGAEKCGTTSLYHYLSQHPQFLPSIEKELDFFDIEFGRGIDWYLAHFPPIPDQEKDIITGEVSPNYIYHRHAPQRVKDFFPDTKLIVLLRDPVERTVSRYYMLHKKVNSGFSLEQKINAEIKDISSNMKEGQVPWPVLNRCRNVGNSLYFFHLQKWLKVFPREQFLVVKSADFYKNPALALENIFDYLEVPNHKLPEYKQYNAGSYNPITEEMRTKLAEFFQPYNQKLEDLLGMEFNW